jgi:hypothetical protein
VSAYAFGIIGEYLDRVAVKDGESEALGAYLFVSQLLGYAGIGAAGAEFILAQE